MRCNDCVYYSFLHDECRRHAPSVHGETGEARWPTMTHHDSYAWCGEFSRNDVMVNAKRTAKDPEANAEQVETAKEIIAKWESR